MMAPNSLFLRYLTVTSTIGFVLGLTHGATTNMIKKEKSLKESFPDILTHTVGGVIMAQYFPVAVPYYVYTAKGCPRIQKIHAWREETRLT
jgi:hypothetical protein